MSTTRTAPVTGKNAAGEDVVIEIPIPDANNAAAWNESMQTTAEKAGVTIEGVTKSAAAAAAPADGKKPEGDQPTLYVARLTVNGQEIEFKDADPAKVLEQYTAAVQAAQLAASTPAKTVEEKKPEASAADMFTIGTQLLGGDASGLKDYLKKSNILGEMLAEEGVSIEALKAATQKTLNDETFDAIKAARDQFLEKVKTGESDFPGGLQNEKQIGFMIPLIQAEDRKAGKSDAITVDTFVRAYAKMKEHGLVFTAEAAKPGEKKDPPPDKKKEAPGSTAIGTSGGSRENGAPQQAAGTRNKIELDMSAMSTQQFMQAYNLAIDQGYKENVDLFIKQ